VDDASDPRLTRLLGDPELAWLVARVRRRLEHGQSLDATVTLTNATATQRQAVSRLLGRAPRPGQGLSVSLPAVDAVLRASGASAGGLAHAVELLGGAVHVRADEARREAGLWDMAFAPLAQAVGDHGTTAVSDWLEVLRATGAMKRLARDPSTAAPLLRRAADVLSALPAEAEPLGRFAARVAGGAHALDDGRPLATLVLGMIRAIGGVAPAGPDESRAEGRREAWATVGVLLDELSSTVLCVGLTGDGSSVGARILGAGAATGEPVVLTLRQLVRDAPRWPAAMRGLDVRICENPVVVAAAADALGPACPALVCTGGQPSAAVMVLLRSLDRAGARLSHHGDFDWGGVRIGNVLRARLPQVASWRFGAADYEAAVGSTGPALTGTTTEATWDRSLGTVMRQAGRAVEEETVLEQLLDDLALSRSRDSRRQT